jgi:hypothetical protein
MKGGDRAGSKFPLELFKIQRQCSDHPDDATLGIVRLRLDKEFAQEFSY